MAVSFLINLGEVSREQGDLTGAARYYEESLEEAAKQGHRGAMSSSLCNLGEMAAAQNDPTRAARYYEQALALWQEFSGRPLSGALGGLGHVAAGAGDVTLARSLFVQTLLEARARGNGIMVLYALVGFARLKALAGETLRAAEWPGPALDHPSAETDVRGRGDALSSELRAAFPVEQLEAALARGAKLELEAVVGEILGET
jgi:tetratricopeptide (TPR) repeat protein